MADDANKKKVSSKRTVDKWKKKKWFKVFASKEFDNRVIAETPAEKEKNVLGRTVKVNLGEITGERQKRHITLKFKIIDVKGQQAFTEISKHEINPGYITRMVRRRTSKVESVQIVQTKDNRKLKIKTIALSQNKLNKRQETAIRKQIAKSIEENAQGKDFSPLIQLIVFGVLASKLFKDLKKIALLKRVEIAKTTVLE